MPYACTVAYNNECEGAATTICFSCGEPVCKACSSKISYRLYGVKRLCKPCQEEETEWT